MKVLWQLTALILFSCATLLPLPPKIQAAEGSVNCTRQHNQGPTITTPTRAFLKRQCDAVKRGIAKVPGVKQLLPNSRKWGTRLK
jgi:hypothetical protein